MKEYPVEIRDNTIPEKLKGRTSLFFDINVWIDLADRKSSLANRTRRRLKVLVEEGEIFCPLFAPVIWELYKQQFDSIIRVGELMEELSLNLCFAPKEEIFRKEAENFVFNYIENRNSDLTIEDIYVPVTGYLSTKASLTFPKGWTNNDSKNLARILTKEIVGQKFTDFLKMRKGSFLNFENVQKSQFSEVWKERREFCKGDKSKMWRVEEELIAKKYIIPTFNEVREKLPLTLQLEFIKYLDTIPRDKYEGCMDTILTYMPALKNEIEILAVSGYDTSLDYS